MSAHPATRSLQLPDRSLKVLLTTASLDVLCLVEEAFFELAELHYAYPWIPPCTLTHAETIGATLELLQGESFDALLLDMKPPDGHGSQALRTVQRLAPDLAVILLAAREEEHEAIALIRQGAQDCLVTTEIDCLPLARSIRCAIERQRLAAALRRLALTDILTGLFTEAGFQQIAETHRRMAGHRADYTLCLFELDGFDRLTREYGAHEGDTLVVRFADVLRNVFDGALIGVLDRTRFAVLASALAPAAALAERVSAGIAGDASRRGGRCPVSSHYQIVRVGPGTPVATAIDEAAVAVGRGGSLARCARMAP